MRLPPSTTLEEIGPDYPVLRVRHPRAEARIALHGAHVMEWTPAGHSPVLYLSPTALFLPGEPIRGGVPICWPWFGQHPEDPALGQHGFARSRFWKWHSIAEDDHGVRVRMELSDDAGTHRLWPHDFHVVADIRIGATLEMRLTTSNTGDHGFRVGGALHTYLRVGDVTRCHVEGLDGADYLDTIGAVRRSRQTGRVEFQMEVDRIYRHSEGCRLVDESIGRQITLTQQGAKDIVIWNPWIEKGGRLKGLPPDGFRHFVCIETANADGRLPAVPPGGIHEMSASIRPSAILR